MSGTGVEYCLRPRLREKPPRESTKNRICAMARPMMTVATPNNSRLTAAPSNLPSPFWRHSPSLRASDGSIGE